MTTHIVAMGGGGFSSSEDYRPPSLDRYILSLTDAEKAELEGKGEHYFTKGEEHGLSVFFRIDDDVFHTYSTYARGVESLTDSYSLLDVTPYGRQEDWEDSPSGWPQKPTYG